MSYQLAQVNVARWEIDRQSREASPFFDALDRYNALAEASPGFVWRLQTEEGNATEVPVFEDARMMVNLSVWEDVESLKAYAYRSDHSTIMRRRREWFQRMEGYLALWWIPHGTIPTVEEAEKRLRYLRDHGPTEEAFTFKDQFPPPSRD